MTPKEKAEELVYKYYNKLPQWVNHLDAKQCALIAVDEIIKALDESLINADVEYYKQVKNEIEKL
jgi:methionine synthase II (cobalamin-independent)